jgi:uncharacterized repeat protein (TIGR01451 family)
MHHVLVKVLRLSVITVAAMLLLAPSGRAAMPTDMSLKVTGTSFKVGLRGRYTVTVANRGSQPTDDAVHVRTTLPAGLTLISQQVGAWTCSAAGQSVDCVTQRSLGVGKTSTFHFWVSVCTAAFPGVVTSFQVVYAADPNSGNDVATRSTSVRPGQCVLGTRTPTASSGAPTATRTPLPAGTRTPTPVPGNPAAPVVTSFTCNGGAQCTVSAGESFMLNFSFTDADANAISWLIMAQRDDGFTTQVGRGRLGTPTGSATIPLQFPGFTCSFSHCRQDMWEFSLTATDTTGLTSTPVSVAITVLGS